MLLIIYSFSAVMSAFINKENSVHDFEQILSDRPMEGVGREEQKTTTSKSYIISNIACYIHI
jgi:hypothetical protein